MMPSFTEVLADRDEALAAGMKLQAENEALRVELEKVARERDDAKAEQYTMENWGPALTQAQADLEAARKELAQTLSACEFQGDEIRGLQADLEAKRVELTRALADGAALRRALEQVVERLDGDDDADHPRDSFVLSTARAAIASPNPGAGWVSPETYEHGRAFWQEQCGVRERGLTAREAELAALQAEHAKVVADNAALRRALERVADWDGLGIDLDKREINALLANPNPGAGWVSPEEHAKRVAKIGTKLILSQANESVMRKALALLVEHLPEGEYPGLGDARFLLRQPNPGAPLLAALEKARAVIMEVAAFPLREKGRWHREDHQGPQNCQGCRIEEILAALEKVKP